MIEFNISQPNDLQGSLDEFQDALAALSGVSVVQSGRPAGAAFLDPVTIAVAGSTLLAPVLGAFAAWLLSKRAGQQASPNIVIIVTTANDTVRVEVADGVVDPDALVRLGDVSGVVRIAEATGPRADG